MKEFTLIITFVLMNILITNYFNEQFKNSGNELLVEIVSESGSLAHPAKELFENVPDLNDTGGKFQYATIVSCNNNQLTASTNSILDLSFFKDLLSDLKNNIKTIIEKLTGDTVAPAKSVMYEEDLIA